MSDGYAEVGCARGGMSRLKAATYKTVVGCALLGVLLSTATLIAHGVLLERLRAHEIRLSTTLAAMGKRQPAEAQHRHVGQLLPLTPVTAARIRRSGECADPHECEVVGQSSAAGLHAAHLAPAFSGDRHVLHEVDQAKGYMAWNYSQVSDPALYSNTSYLTDSPVWLTIEESGIYYVYCQITWWGRATSETYLTSTSKSLLNTLVKASYPDPVQLMAGMSTQYQDSCSNLDHEDCPLDSSHISGVFHFTVGTRIAVVADAMAAICTHKEKTFMGIFMLRQDLDE